MELDQLPDDRESEPRAALLAGARRVGAPEAVEDVRQVFGSDPLACVAHLAPRRVLAIGQCP